MATHPARRGTALTEVNEVIKDLVPKDQSDEAITAVHRFPSREAQWAPMPGWIRKERRSTT